VLLVSHDILLIISSTFKTVNSEQALDLTVRLGDCLPPEHLARFVVDSVGLLDLSALYAHYGSRGGEPYAPEVLLGLLFYGYATGVFSSRKIERATYEAVPFRFIAGNQHPDMRQSWRSAQSGSARRGAAQVAAHRRCLCQDHARATSSTSPIQSRA
jgi:transposase